MAPQDEVGVSVALLRMRAEIEVRS